MNKDNQEIEWACRYPETIWSPSRYPMVSIVRNLPEASLFMIREEYRSAPDPHSGQELLQYRDNWSAYTTLLEAKFHAELLLIHGGVWPWIEVEDSLEYCVVAGFRLFVRPNRGLRGVISRHIIPGKLTIRDFDTTEEAKQRCQHEALEALKVFSIEATGHHEILKAGEYFLSSC